MCLFSHFLDELHEHLTGNKLCPGTAVRKHTKKLTALGDVSFPLNIRNWYQLIDVTKLNEDLYESIFDYLYPHKDLKVNLDLLIIESNNWHLKIAKFKIIKDNVHLYLNRDYALISGIQEVINASESYGLIGKQDLLVEKICIKLDESTECSDLSIMNLSELRLNILKNVIENLLKCFQTDKNECDNACVVTLTLKSDQSKETNTIVCGAVLNDQGVKDIKITAAEIYKKRATDMQLMAQHKYGVRLESTSLTHNYFENLGRASVSIEMLQNKPHKPIKMSFNNTQMAHKGPSFICYNCARISALCQEFHLRTKNKVYPDLPPINTIDFRVLSQAEEWELFFVYVLQFPEVIRSCIYDVAAGTVNPHNLTCFLANLSSIFSIYYRRVKIFVNRKDHLIPVLHARMYLLQSLQQVFYNSFFILNIEPIKKM